MAKYATDQRELSNFESERNLYLNMADWLETEEGRQITPVGAAI
jgi:hypothetical protein